MCCEDVQLNRRQPSQEKIVTVAATRTPLVAASSGRVAIILVGVDAGTVHCTTLSTSAANVGVHVGATLPPVVIHQKDYGGLVQREWFGIGSAGGQSLTIIEVFDTWCKDPEWKNAR